MRRVGLVGWPVSHSLSPVMHNAAFAALGMDWEYILLPAEPDRLGETVEGLQGRGIEGANVTVPHKQAVVEHVDRLSDEAAAIGAVNTISVAGDGVITGSNTDGMGFLADLRDHGIDPGGWDALVVGTGGSARAVVHALASAGARRVVILGRNLESAGELARRMLGRFPSTTFEDGPFPGGLGDVLEDVRLFVNCTPLGMTGHMPTGGPFADAPFGEQHVVYDLVYGPAPTPLQRQAQRCGARVLGGLGMLVQQGAISFEIWTGEKPPLEVMRRAAENGPGTR